MSIRTHVVRRRSSFILSSLALALALTTSPAPAAADLEGIEGVNAEWATLNVVCNVDSLGLTINPNTGGVMFHYDDSTGTTQDVVADEIGLAFDGHSSIPLDVRYWQSNGKVEVSPDGEDTTVVETRRGKVTVDLIPDPTGYQKDYLLVFLDPDGQELPSMPTVKVKTKPSCPMAPVKPPGSEHE